MSDPEGKPREELQREEKEALEKERYDLLRVVAGWMEMPMVVLAFVWLALLVVELTLGLPRILQHAGTVIWIIFILDFLLQFTIAPRKIAYLRGNLLTAVALVLPALRIFRLARALRVLRMGQATRGIRLVRIVTSMNRSMSALGASLSRRGFGYVVGLTVIVAVAGAAGMYAFERGVDAERGLHSFPAALWWTLMLLATMGTDYWPRTPEGRILCYILALYAFAVFGYVTATIATFLLGHEAESEQGELASARSLAALRAEIQSLREEVRALSLRGGDQDKNNP